MNHQWKGLQAMVNYWIIYQVQLCVLLSIFLNCIQFTGKIYCSKSILFHMPCAHNFVAFYSLIHIDQLILKTILWDGKSRSHPPPPHAHSGLRSHIPNIKVFLFSRVKDTTLESPALLTASPHL